MKALCMLYTLSTLLFAVSALNANYSIHHDHILYYEGLRVRNFLERASHVFCQEGFTGKENMVFSAVKIYASLITIYTVASPVVKKELEANLALKKEGADGHCSAVNTLLKSFYSKQNYKNLNVIYESIMLYQQNMSINKSVLENNCFKNKISAIDFSTPNNAMLIINKWFSQLTMNEYGKYLSEAPNPESLFLLINGINFDYKHLHSYQQDGVIMFEDIQGTRFRTKAMSRLADVYMQEDEDHIIIREDQQGGEVYSLVVIPKNIPAEDEGEFLKKLVYLRVLIGAASDLTQIKRLKVKLPEISITTRLDLAPLLPDISSTSLFKKDAITELFRESIYLKQFPYYEFINIAGNEGGLKQSEDESDPVIEVNKPFLFLLIEKNYSIPLLTALYLGNPEKTL